MDAPLPRQYRLGSLGSELSKLATFVEHGDELPWEVEPYSYKRNHVKVVEAAQGRDAPIARKVGQLRRRH